MNFLTVPKSFNSVSQVICFNQENEQPCSLIINFPAEIKNKVINKTITIYFVQQKKYQMLLANNWFNNQLVLQNEELNFQEQNVVVIYSYQSLLSYILNNIS